MKYFVGNNPIAVEILNSVLDVLRSATVAETKSSDERVVLTILLGRKEMDAINMIEFSDPSIERDPITGDIRLYGFHVVPVLMDSYAKAVAAIDLKQVCPVASKATNKLETMNKETYENQTKDSDTIFTAISTSGAIDFKDAEKMVVMMYVMDMSFSRAGISHALKRLEKFYSEK